MTKVQRIAIGALVFLLAPPLAVVIAVALFLAGVWLVTSPIAIGVVCVVGIGALAVWCAAKLTNRPPSASPPQLEPRRE